MSRISGATARGSSGVPVAPVFAKADFAEIRLPIVPSAPAFRTLRRSMCMVFSEIRKNEAAKERIIADSARGLGPLAACGRENPRGLHLIFPVGQLCHSEKMRPA